jgi:hypothetical protein
VDHPLRHLHQVHLVNGMDLMMLVLHQYVVGNYLFRFRRLLVVVHQDVLQNLDVQNLVVLPPFLDEVHLFLADVVVDAELRHLLRMDCYQDAVGVELRHLLRMDCYQDAVQRVSHLVQEELLVLQLLLLLQPWLLLAQPFQHRVMP